MATKKHSRVTREERAALDAKLKAARENSQMLCKDASPRHQYFETNRNGLAAGFYCHSDSGVFRHAWYKPSGLSTEDLLRMGLARRAATRLGIIPEYLAEGYRGYKDTMVFTDEAIRRDERFRLAMLRVVNGAPMPDFELPTAPRGHIKNDDGAEAA